jgi:hypothetical protein
MLSHVAPADPSALVLFSQGLPPQRIFLLPGEFLIFFADSVIHARERMLPHECVSIAAFGFKLIEGSDGPSPV